MSSAARARLGVLLSVVTVGLSQILFNLVLMNPAGVPAGGGVYVAALFWAQALPALLLLAVELLVVRSHGEGRIFRLWRAALYTATLLSFLRQAQLHHMDGPFSNMIGRAETFAVFWVLVVVLVAWSYRAWRGFHLLFSWLGLLALLLTGIFIVKSGVWGPAWREEKDDPRADAAAGPPVFLVVFDEFSYDVLLKDGALDAEAFPNLAALAADGAWFTDATANHRWTTEAVPGLLSGRLFPDLNSRPFFDKLPRGYGVVAIEPCFPIEDWIRRTNEGSTPLAIRGGSLVLNHDPVQMALYLGFLLSESPFVPKVVDRLLVSLSGKGGSIHVTLEDDEERFLDARARGRLTYWHCMLPHEPFRYAPGGRAEPKRAFSFHRTSADRKEVWIAYREQVRCVDRLVGRIVARMKAAGLYDEAILVLTADHGLRTFGWGEPEGYPEVQTDRAVHVPLFIRAPSVKPGLYDLDYQAMDLAPTILDLVGVQFAEGEFDGVSAFAPKRPDRPKLQVHGHLRLIRDPASHLWTPTK